MTERDASLQFGKPFPKERPKLPDAYLEIYADWMRKNRQGLTKTTSLSIRLEQWMQRKVAEDLKQAQKGAVISTLELGSGTGNHLAFDRRSDHYDVVEPMDELFNLSPKTRIRQRFRDIADINDTERYDRIVSIAVLEHLEDLPAVLAKARTLLKMSGSFRAGIPSEGGWLWRQAWRHTTARTFKRQYGLRYERLLAYEHLNTAAEIRREVEKVFGFSTTQFFGLGNQFSFYQFIEATKSSRPLNRGSVID